MMQRACLFFHRGMKNVITIYKGRDSRLILKSTKLQLPAPLFLSRFVVRALTPLAEHIFPLHKLIGPVVGTWPEAAPSVNDVVWYPYWQLRMWLSNLNRRLHLLLLRGKQLIRMIKEDGKFFSRIQVVRIKNNVILAQYWPRPTVKCLLCAAWRLNFMTHFLLYSASYVNTVKRSRFILSKKRKRQTKKIKVHSISRYFGWRSEQDRNFNMLEIF